MLWIKYSTNGLTQMGLTSKKGLELEDAVMVYFANHCQLINKSKVKIQPDYQNETLGNRIKLQFNHSIHSEIPK